MFFSCKVLEMVTADKRTNCIGLLCLLGQGRSTWVMSLNFFSGWIVITFGTLTSEPWAYPVTRAVIPFITPERETSSHAWPDYASLCPCSSHVYLSVAFSNTLSVIKQYLTNNGTWKSKPSASKTWTVLMVPDCHVWPKSKNLCIYCIFPNCSNMLDVILLLLYLVQIKMCQASSS